MKTPMKKKIEAILNDLSDSNDYNLKYIPEHNYNELVDKLNALFSLHVVVGRSEQLPCPKCGDYGTIDNQDGTVSTCPCHY